MKDTEFECICDDCSESIIKSPNIQKIVDAIPEHRKICVKKIMAAPEPKQAPKPSSRRKVEDNVRRFLDKLIRAAKDKKARP